MSIWRLHTATLFYSLLGSLPGIDLFLDVGSLDGREAFAVEARLPQAKCIAIEPNPRNIALIQTEIARKGSRIELETFAAGNENGTTSFYTRIPLNAKNYGASSLLKFAEDSRDEEFSTNKIDVQLRRLDGVDSITSYSKLALWIDVEGAGYHVLEGLASIIQKVQIVHIEVETQPCFEGEKLATDIIHLMSTTGFKLIGSNLDKNLRRPQGDLVFLREHSLSEGVIRRAILSAWAIENFSMHRLARRVLPPKLYRTGRNWLIHYARA
ncbi:MAG TPA: FkbM family methyltransferase [Ktedonobacteraceae bacterium]|nr:FkbM family methyltransferase [Ktedonobacteraceae bacterium]